MDNARKDPESEALPTGVFELPGEPAILINGVPDISQGDTSHVLSNSSGDAEPLREVSVDTEFLGNANFGEWLEGREIRKLFGDKYYTGTVTQFDKETGWYRLVYEDGDFEDLDWCELEDVLMPLDITVPLKTLALKIIKKGQKTVHKSERTGTQSTIVKAKSLASKGIINEGT